jgi:hypothetical protein
VAGKGVGEAAWLISDQATPWSRPSEALMEHPVRLLVVVAWITAPAVLSGSALAQNTTQSVAPVAAQSACPEPMPDWVACGVSAAQGPAPALQRRRPPLRGSDGTTIIGPNRLLKNR